LTLLGLATRKRREHGANLLLAAAMASPDGVTPPNMATERTGAHRGPWTLSNVARPGNAAGVTAGLRGALRKVQGDGPGGHRSASPRPTVNPGEPASRSGSRSTSVAMVITLTQDCAKLGGSVLQAVGS
jgi:hypothetical protein